jgi:hypothetical protein
MYWIASAPMSQIESFRAKREALVLRLRDREKLTFKQIGDRFDRSACRAAQIYQAARRKIQFPPNGLSNRLNHLLAKAGFSVEKQAIASALRAGKLYPHCYPPTYGVYAHRDLCEWAGVDPATVLKKGSYFETYRANGLSYRANHILKYAGIPATKEAILESLKNGSLTPTKRPIGYGKMTHAELCRWVGVTPHLLRKRKMVGS